MRARWRMVALAGTLPLLATCVTTPRSNSSADALPPPVAGQSPIPRPPIVPEPALTLTLDSTEARQGSLLYGRTNARRLTLNGEEVRVADDGRFIVALDRDAAASAQLVAERGRDVQRLTLNVAPGGWRIENVDAPFRGSAGSDAEFERRRPAELAQINAARARTDIVSDGWRQNFIWPARGRISGLFGSQRVYRGQPGSYHSGVDVASGAGSVFVAPADGVVTLAATSPFTLEGNLLIVDHGFGLSSAFLHAQSLDVRTGERVTQGQRLGRVGATGRVSGPHLHWAMRWRGARIDPQRLVGEMSSAAGRQNR